ncbi:hypothetical protein [Promicromonospora sp. NPDC023805]|uniref:hypothetical protein n=1 Tax=Promicromonospora sp. NPDC023805 TaxID=3154696 RepID=UPI0033D3DB89
MPWIRINDAHLVAQIDPDVLALPQVDLLAEVPCSRVPRGCPDPARWATCPPCGHQVFACDVCRRITDANVAKEIAVGLKTTVCNTCETRVPMPISWRDL